MYNTLYGADVYFGPFFWVCFLISGVVFGFATSVVIQNKGYDESWFLWGFFFGIIALIVACAKPENRDRYNGTHTPALTHKTTEDWQCLCGRTNTADAVICPCGLSKHMVLNAENGQSQDVRPIQQEDPKRHEENKPSENEPSENEEFQPMNETDRIYMLKAYKELVDAGILSQEEFDAKKKQLLGL